MTRHLTFANVCSALALVVALGTGGAYAANTVRSKDIVNGQVKTKDLRDGAVTSSKLKDGTVARVDLAAGSVDGGRLVDESVTAADLAPDSVLGGEIAAGAVDGDEVVDGSLTAGDLAPSSVTGSELAANAVDSAKVTNNSLTFADITGGGNAGSLSIPAGSVANGRCESFALSVSGATAGDAIVISARGALQEGVFLYGVRVDSATVATVALCNLSGTTQAVINDLPVRVLTFQ